MSVIVFVDWEDPDPAPDLLVAELSGRGVPVYRLDLAESTGQATVAAELAGAGWSGSFVTEPDAVVAGLAGASGIELDTVSGVYYRRPTGYIYDLDTTCDPDSRPRADNRLGVGGLVCALGSWLNQPQLSGYAEYQPVQLRAAVDTGLRVPRTCLSNDPAAMAGFVGEVGDAVRVPLVGHGTVTDDYSGYLPTTPITSIAPGQRAAGGVQLVQERIPARHEVRVVLVDEHAFAARRSSRAAGDYTPEELPPPIRRAVAGLMGRLGLRFATVDFVVDEQERWWFQHCDPNGRWTPVEARTGLPITATLADALQRPRIGREQHDHGAATVLAGATGRDPIRQ